jgi:Tol biopolymer transport system component
MEQLHLIKANVLHPTWSPDGKRILFGTIPTITEDPFIYIADLATHQVSTVPGSQGLFTPAWSPDGRYIIALRGDSSELMLLDTVSGVWSTLTGPKFGYPVWSPDSRYVYSFSSDGTGPKFYRIEVKTKKVEQILRLPGFRLLDRWIGLHPDGSLLVAQNTGIQEIYALELDRGLYSHASSR